MKFYILKDIFQMVNDKRNSSKLNAWTSVVAYLNWLLKCVSCFGKIIPLDEEIREDDFAAILGKPEAIFLSSHNTGKDIRWSKIPRRTLNLSLGGLLNPEGLLTAKYQSHAQIELVSTQFQLEQLKYYFNDSVPEMSVFPPKVDTDFYVPPDINQRLVARQKEGIRERQLHIVYAGRWIVTKGICQLIRILDIWPMSNIVLTLVGDVEYNNNFDFSFAQHSTFMHFLNEEILQRERRSWLRLHPAKDKKALRELFWSADFFVNPSVQPDENFGITPREALSCGVPVITTNFCGLRPLAESLPWKGVDTYPSLFGSRFSLKQFQAVLLEAIRKCKLLSPKQYHNIIIKECDVATSMKRLRWAIDYLKNKAAEKSIDIRKTKCEIKKRLYRCIDGRVFNNFINTMIELPKGNYVYGDCPSDRRLPIIQGIYSAKSTPPEVQRGSKWRGFFRIVLWEKERAILEFGFPGPRVRRYPRGLWSSLINCSNPQKSPNEYVFIPKDKTQISIVQELVDLGYLVSDDY